MSALNDLEQPFSAELDEAATSVTSCLNNVLQSASGQSNGAAEEAKAGLKILQKTTIPLVWTLNYFLISFFNFHAMLSNLKLYKKGILGDPGAASRDDRLLEVKVYCKIYRPD